ncbi:hypothetical protein EDB85DRAFT_1848876, partial [Lactarius pseudohatsudake]
LNDIKAKGASRNYNTKPNEKMYGFPRKLYLNRTNFKNVAPQILKHEHIALVGELIRGQINELDAAIQPPVQGGSSCQRRRSMFDAGAVILGSRQAPVTFEALEAQGAQNKTFRNFRARLAAWLT